MEGNLPEVLDCDPRVGCQGIDLRDGFIGIIEKIFRFSNGQELIQLGRSGYTRCDLNPSQVRIVMKREKMQSRYQELCKKADAGRASQDEIEERVLLSHLLDPELSKDMEDSNGISCREMSHLRWLNTTPLLQEH